MKAFIFACLGMIVISVGAAVIFETVGFSSSETYSSDNVRL